MIVYSIAYYLMRVRIPFMPKEVREQTSSGLSYTLAQTNDPDLLDESWLKAQHKHVHVNAVMK